jgi:hypothetical protein
MAWLILTDQGAGRDERDASMPDRKGANRGEEVR